MQLKKRNYTKDSVREVLKSMEGFCNSKDCENLVEGTRILKPCLITNATSLIHNCMSYDFSCWH